MLPSPNQVSGEAGQKFILLCGWISKSKNRNEFTAINYSRTLGFNLEIDLPLTLHRIFIPILFSIKEYLYVFFYLFFYTYLYTFE